ncbi:MAG: transcriptional repressor [Phycisphaeraceae bacterium]|nr:transcriptional repressor [Phycisphaeraceae bacterium]
MQHRRNTKQRQAIYDVLAEKGTPLSPREILDHAQSHVGGIGMATVYRTLKMLTGEGLVQSVEIPGEAPRFELTGKDHHHHFYCRGCERVFEVEGCPTGLAALAPAGFSVEAHELVLFGRCPECGPAGKSAKPAGSVHRCCSRE